ncbi:uncharacterized protein [Eucyclogobius newberryi]|uniref:uncharacterized protein n=1 Tax=Eucyclogobius newberryi TaxID=166745 RepID=UPI003B5B1760
MAARRAGFSGSMASSANSVCGNAMSRKANPMNISDRTGTESCFDRKADKPTHGAIHGSMTVMSLKSRLAPTIHTAMSAAVDALLGEMVIVLNETQLELVHKEEENERLKVRLEVSARELKNLQDCLCSAQKLIDQLQISYSGAHVVSQSVFAPPLSSMTSLATGMERDSQNQRGVTGPDLGLGGSVDESLQGFGQSNDYKMCQLSIQPDDSFESNSPHMCSNPRSDERQSQGPGLANRFEIKEEQRPVPTSVQPNRKEPGGEGQPGSQNVAQSVDHGFLRQGFGQSNDYKMCQLSIQPDDSFGSNSPHMCSNPRPDERQSQGPGLANRFDIKEEQRPVPTSVQPNRKERGGEGQPGSQNVDHGFLQVAGEGASQRSFSQPLPPQRSVRDCSAAMPPGGPRDQKMVSGTSVNARISPGQTEDAAGPSGEGTAAGPTADRPHHCLECGKTFRLISSLKKHIRIHTGEKPYPCGVCGRRFRESGALKTHLRIHTGEKPYSCSECGTCFRHLDGLRKHRRTHTGEKPYVCSICGKRLSRLQHLKHHQLIHTGERPCSCPFCNRTFKEPAALRKHVRTHREEGGHMGISANEDQQEPIDDMNNLHPAAPSPQMRFEEWAAEEEDSVAEEEDSAVVNCV